MNMKKMKRTRLLGCVLAVVMVVSMMLSMTVSTSAAPTANQAVNDAKSGIVQIQVWFTDLEGNIDEPLQYGTGFLINETTVVTCQHVVTAFDDSFYREWADYINAQHGLNRTAAQVKECLELRIMVYRDVYIKATVKTASTAMDYAVLSLAQPVSNRTPLKIRNSSELQQTEAVFALGYPADIADKADKNFFRVEDVTITSGNVNKVADMSFPVDINGNGVYDEGVDMKYENVNCVESSALITSGNSGGPLVDVNGAVVGINAAGNETRNYAVSSQQLIEVLSALSIPYTEASDSNVAPTQPAPSVTEPSNEPEPSVTEPTSAPTEAPKADEDEDEKDDDKAAGGLDTTTLIIIGVGAVVLILIIVLIVVLSSKKKPAAAPVAPVAPVQPVRPVAPVAPVQPVRPAAPPVTPGTTVLGQDAGATTVLGANAGATTVLSQNVNGGFLVRVSNNERVPICTADFTVGRERNSVDYCISGNSNISRVHARFVVRDGKTFIIDNKAANGTFVNGVKSRAGQEVELNNGDKITLADEKFEFNK